MKQPWTETKEALFTTYQTDAHGLSGGEAQKRLAQYGENKLIEGKQKSVLRVFAEQFADLLVVILLIAAIISALTGGWEGTIVIITVLILNAILGTVQHFKAQKSLESLKAMSDPMRACCVTEKSLKFPRFPSCRGISCCWRQGILPPPMVAFWRIILCR